MKNKMVIVVGPSGAGKSSFLERALLEIPGLVDTVTYTTRPMRPKESEGHPYHFVTPARFAELIEEKFFVEWAHVHSYQYGTPRHQIDEAWAAGKTIIMDVDVQGAKTFKRHFPQALGIFILPPSLDVLRQRIAKRDAGRSIDLEVRMESAQRELAQAGDFDIQLINDEFEASYGNFKKIIEDLLKNQ